MQQKPPLGGFCIIGLGNVCEVGLNARRVLL